MYLIRYGELALKSKIVRSKFENILLKNIKTILEKENKKAKISNIYGRFLAETEENLDDQLKRIFGVVSFSPCFKTISDLEEIKKLVLETIDLKKGLTFAVRCNRIGNQSYSSKDVEKEMGSAIVEKFGNKVDLTKPDKTIWIDTRNMDTYLYTKVIEGPGGLPLGTAGKVFCSVENFNDVAASWLMMKRGCEVIFSGKHPEELEKWNSGRPLIFEDTENTFKKYRYLASVKGDTEIKKWEDTICTFRPLIGFSEKKLKDLENVIKAN